MGYVDVRSYVHLFWWLYSVLDDCRPLILWLQGGPGASGTSLGNFQEIGPMDEFSNMRNFTWLREADLLFIDNPVGTGFSNTTDQSAYTKDVDEIATDLVKFFQLWIPRFSRYENRDVYIFSESYGGKMTAVLGRALYQTIIKGELRMNLQGIALGDSWISPMDYVSSWGRYLRAFVSFSVPVWDCV